MNVPAWLPFVNLALILLVIVAVGVLVWVLARRKRMFDQMFHHLADQMKEELPPIIVGEMLTRWDLVGYERRITDLETKADWLLRQQDGEPP